MLSQFTPEGKWQGLKDWIAVPGVYVAGRLDADSEGLLLLTNDGQLQARIADPRHKMEKTYWVQVEGVPADAALQRLRDGVELNDGKTLPARVRLIEPQPDMWPRNPPIRVRQNIPDCWIELIIREGRNRQVRRMTAAIGHPTLRLVRMAVGPYSIAGLERAVGGCVAGLGRGFSAGHQAWKDHLLQATSRPASLAAAASCCAGG